MLVPRKASAPAPQPPTVRVDVKRQRSRGAPPKQKASSQNKGMTKQEVAKVKRVMDKDSMVPSSVFTRPNAVSIPMLWVFDTTTSGVGINYLIHAVIAQLYQHVDDIFDYDRTFGPVHIKAYLVWAMLDKFRLCGGLIGTQMHTIPQFPADFSIPKAWHRILQHIGTYDKGGCSFTPQITYSTVPGWTNVHCISSDTGINKSPVGNLDLTLIRYNTTKKEYYETTKAVAAQTMDYIYTNGDAISRLISRSPVAVKYGSPSTKAIDGSYYSWVTYGTTSASFCTHEFDAHIAYMFSNHTLAQYWEGYPVVKGITTYGSFLNGEDAASSLINGLDFIAESFVLVCSMQSDIRRKTFYFDGQPLSTFLVRQVAFGISAWKEALNVTVEEFSRMSLLSDAQTWALVTVCNMAIHRRLAEIGFPCNSRYGPAYSLPSAVVLTVPLPLPIAAYIKTVAPYVCKKTGQLITYTPCGVVKTRGSSGTYACVDFWSVATNATSMVADTDLWSAVDSPASSSVSLDGVTINAAWIDWTTPGANRVFYPRGLLDAVLRLFFSIGATTTDLADLFVTLPTMSIAPAFSSSIGAYRIYTDGTFLVSTGWAITERYVMTSVGSYVLLGQGDVMQAAFCCHRSVLESADSTTKMMPQHCPFLYVFQTTSLGISASLQGALRKAFAPGSSFMIEMARGPRTRDAEIGYTKIGSVDSSRGWWQYWDKVMDGVANASSFAVSSLGDAIKPKLQQAVGMASEYAFNRAVQAAISYTAPRNSFPRLQNSRVTIEEVV